MLAAYHGYGLTGQRRFPLVRRRWGGGDYHALRCLCRVVRERGRRRLAPALQRSGSNPGASPSSPPPAGAHSRGPARCSALATGRGVADRGVESDQLGPRAPPPSMPRSRGLPRHPPPTADPASEICPRRPAADAAPRKGARPPGTGSQSAGQGLAGAGHRVSSGLTSLRAFPAESDTIYDRQRRSSRAVARRSTADAGTVPCDRCRGIRSRSTS